MNCAQRSTIIVLCIVSLLFSSTLMAGESSGNRKMTQGRQWIPVDPVDAQASLSRAAVVAQHPCFEITGVATYWIDTRYAKRNGASLIHHRAVESHIRQHVYPELVRLIEDVTERQQRPKLIVALEQVECHPSEVDDSVLVIRFRFRTEGSWTPMALIKLFERCAEYEIVEWLSAMEETWGAKNGAVRVAVRDVGVEPSNGKQTNVQVKYSITGTSETVHVACPSDPQRVGSITFSTAHRRICLETKGRLSLGEEYTGNWEIPFALDDDRLAQLTVRLVGDNGAVRVVRSEPFLLVVP